MEHIFKKTVAGLNQHWAVLYFYDWKTFGFSSKK
jgi:hypothetical protein